MNQKKAKISFHLQLTLKKRCILFARLALGEQRILVEVPEDFAEASVNFSVPGEAIEVWQQEIDFRIC